MTSILTITCSVQTEIPVPFSQRDIGIQLGINSNGKEQRQMMMMTLEILPKTLVSH